MRHTIKSLLFKKFYDGEGEGGNNPPPPPPPPGGDDKKFTQKDLNDFLAKELSKEKQKYKKTVDELEQLKTAKTTTEEQALALQEQIDTLQKQYMSKEELARQEAEKEAKKQKKLFDDTVAEKQTWQKQYNDLLVENAIRAASTKYDAWSAEQMLIQLGGKSKVVPVLAEGKPTGKYQVVVTIDSDEGKVLEVSADEAIKYMKEKPEIYGNLFKANVNGGVGGGNIGGTGTNGVDLKKAQNDPKYYRENRSKITNG